MNPDEYPDTDSNKAPDVGNTCCPYTSCLSRRFFLSRSLPGMAAILAGSSCTTNRATNSLSFTGLASLQDDIALGEKVHPHILKAHGGVYDNKKLQSYVHKVGMRLANHAEYQEFRYRFTLLNSDEVNALAIPGGGVYITRGLLAYMSSEAELASVLAHEIGHITGRHGIRGQQQQTLANILLTGLAIATGVATGEARVPEQLVDLGSGLGALYLRKYSRDQEREADMLGTKYMTRENYDPQAMVTMQETLREAHIFELKQRGKNTDVVDRHNLLSTHPRSIDRIQDAIKNAEIYGNPEDRLINRKEYLKAIDGMIWGDRVEDGIFNGKRFIHRDLGITFNVPKGFLARNEESQLILRQKKTAARIIFSLGETSTGETFTQYIRKKWDFVPRSAPMKEMRVRGMPAVHTTFPVENGSLRILVIKGKRNQNYHFLFFTPASHSGTLKNFFRQIVSSFRRISSAEAKKIKSMRLLIVPVYPGDNVQKLSVAFPYGPFNQDMFRLLNDLAPGEEPKPHSKVKIIVST